MPKPSEYDKTHLRNITAIGTRIDRIYKKAAEEAARIGTQVRKLKPGHIFSFDEYPQTKKQIDRLMETLRDTMTAAIADGIRKSWTLSNNKNDALARQAIGDRLDALNETQRKHYFSTNEPALNAFLLRKEKGLSLSDRVWRYTQEFKDEIELGLDLGIRDGEPAAEMARDLRQYLRHPDMMFRRFRVREENGDREEGTDGNGYGRRWKRRVTDPDTSRVTWENFNPHDYHPGQGVYRSSYKNARRLAVTETNMAYRTSDYLRWQQMDFVVGIRVVMSNNHTLNGVPFEDICDQLSSKKQGDGKGLYPKDFKFVGWHPHCRCHVETILKTEEEMDADTQRILDGEPTSTDSVNAVTDTPKEFKDWLSGNKERAKGWKTMPYFIRDNRQYTKGFVVDTYDQQERKFTRARKTKDAMTEAVEYLSKLYPDIPNTELASIYHFTRGDVSAYRKLNNQLRRGDVDEFNKAFAGLLERGLEKIEPVTATTYRTIRLNKTRLNEWIATAKKGGTRLFEGFTSTSYKKSVVEDMAAKHTGRKKSETDIILIIRGKTGHPIEDISQFGTRNNGKPNQREVLFMSGRKFRVLSYKDLKDDTHGFEFELEEI